MALYKTQKGTETVSHEGLVLRVNLTGPTWNDGYDHTIEAEVWNPETRRTDRAAYASTMDNNEYHGRATVDATPEVLAAVAARRAYDGVMWDCREAEEKASRPNRGNVALVVRGRKVAPGTEGVIFWYGDGRFGARIGLKTTPEAEPTWVALSNCAIVVPAELTESIAARRAAAQAAFDAAVVPTTNPEAALVAA